MLYAFIICISLFLAFPPKAYAYIDPGAGSLLFQALIAAFVGAAFAIKTYWSRLKSFFGISKGGDCTHDLPDDPKSE